MRLTLARTNNFYMLRTLHANRRKTMLIDVLRVVYMPYARAVKKARAAFGEASASYPYNGSICPIDSALYAVFAWQMRPTYRDEFSLEVAKSMLQQSIVQFAAITPELRAVLNETSSFEKRIHAKTISLEPISI